MRNTAVIDINSKKRRLSPTHLAYELPSFFSTKPSRNKHLHTTSTKDEALQSIHLICGVPGSGKTWIAKQLTNYTWVPHDEHIGKDKDYVSALISAAKKSSNPILAEAPFLTRKLISELKSHGAEVIAYHIDEPAHVIKERYERDRKRPFPQRYATLLKNRRSSKDWDHEGTAKQVLDVLKAGGDE